MFYYIIWSKKGILVTKWVNINFINFQKIFLNKWIFLKKPSNSFFIKKI